LLGWFSKRKSVVGRFGVCVCVCVYVCVRARARCCHENGHE